MRESFMSDRVPHDCPVCGYTLRDMNDVISYEEYQCCTDCQNKFVFRDLSGWMSGSRPSESEIREFRQHLMTCASYLVR
jgi:hypothetical protein